MGERSASCSSSLGNGPDSIRQDRYLLLCPAVGLLGGDLGTASGADQVRAVEAVEAAAAVPPGGIGMSLGALDVVKIEDEAAEFCAFGEGALGHPRWQEAVRAGEFLDDRRRQRHFGDLSAETLVAAAADKDQHRSILRAGVTVDQCISAARTLAGGSQIRLQARIDTVGKVDHDAFRVHPEHRRDELGVHSVDQVDQAGGAQYPGWPWRWARQRCRIVQTSPGVQDSPDVDSCGPP